MTRAKLSGSLLVSKETRTTTAPADLSTILREATEKARGGPVLVWSTAPKETTGRSTAPTTVNGTAAAASCVVAAKPATDLDAPAITGASATTPSDRDAPVRRWVVSFSVAVAVSVLAIGGVSGSLFEQPNRGLRTPGIAPSVAGPMVPERLPSGDVKPQRSAMAATAIPSRLAPASDGPDAAPATVTPHEAALNDPSTDTSGPGAAEIAAPADPAVADAAAAPGEAPGSAALNAALFERGDALFFAGDLAAARMFYERAASAGHRQAALHLGETYDPAFLARTGLIGARGDAPVAAYWYRRARELGASGADILLAAVSTETASGSQ